MNIVKTYIDRSEIDGIGLFAAEFIPKGTIIWKFNSDIDIRFNKIELDKKSKNWTEIERLYFNRYAFEDKNYYYFCSDDAKYCNHSDNPNTGGVECQIALRDIQKNEEITCNYNEIHTSEIPWTREEFKVLKSYKNE